MSDPDDYLDGTRVLGPHGGRKAELAVRGSYEAHAEYWAARSKLDDADKDRLRKLAHHVHNRDFHESQIVNVVIDARRAGLSWQWLADELGMTKQAAQQRYSRFLPRS
uniref:hypothetical protein n=1 Tax=Microbacterium proteolyticum TaxID=1572644 RepID=UPI002416DEB6|nr:hypothetical protein [Microbacterium proteolyticum]